MNAQDRNRRKKGFTLIELMIVIFIVGVLAGVAIPMLSKYLKKSKTAEAGINLRKIYDGEVVYYITERVQANGTLYSKHFLDVGMTPPTASLGSSKRLGSWDGDNWAGIKFIADGPVLYSYEVVTGGVNLTASFTARAVGDLDKDGVTSLFERVGTVTSNGEVQGGSAIYMLKELE
jgi:prepilin-type N-terminal cleavage/methylation domain-containing protein